MSLAPSFSGPFLQFPLIEAAGPAQALFVVLPHLPYLRRLKAFRVGHTYLNGCDGSGLGEILAPGRFLVLS